MTITKQPGLGDGIYRVSDVSRYTRIPHATVRSWFRTKPLFVSDFRETDGSYTVSFHDLIDALVASRLRKRGVKMKIVRRAYEKMETMLDSPHPFCHRDIYHNGQSIFIRAAKELGTPNLQDVVTNQQLFNELDHCFDRVAYSEVSSLAIRWAIASGVVVDPAVAMGHPVVEGTGVTTYVVRNAFYANDKNRLYVARLYGLTASQVRNAVSFEDDLKQAA